MCRVQRKALGEFKQAVVRRETGSYATGKETSWFPRECIDSDRAGEGNRAVILHLRPIRTCLGGSCQAIIEPAFENVNLSCKTQRKCNGSTLASFPSGWFCLDVTSADFLSPKAGGKSHKLLPLAVGSSGSSENSQTGEHFGPFNCQFSFDLDLKPRYFPPRSLYLLPRIRPSSVHWLPPPIIRPTG